MSNLEEKYKGEMEKNKNLNAQSESGDWFKFKEGENVIRILTEPVMFFEKFKVGICFHECGYKGTPKFLAWVIDRKEEDKKKVLKLIRLPWAIMEDIFVLQKDEDKGFEGFPMPYDLKINAKKAGTKEVRYTVFDKKQSDVEPELIKEIQGKTSCEAIIEKLKEKQREKMALDKSYTKMAEPENEDIQVGEDE